MRYLDKIVFINSAGGSIRYAEVNLDGNVHFIGTQGVGKSTLLRSVLFFYNANTQKLGIREGQKNYAEFYYPFLNSYIVYEVKTDTGFFTVLTYKHQNQISFRFINTSYNINNYIADNKAFDSWDKIRDSFADGVSYTPLVTNFTLYRDIIYGNNKEIDRKFRPYYLLESKQYQKVPLTISNVFLNTKLDASVIKQTIISSLGEDGGKIELKRYTAHLKDFERDLSDIKRWTEKDTEKLAGKISGSFNRLNLIDTERQETASKLGFTADKISTEKPEKERRRDELSARQTELQNYQNLLSQQFESVKTDFNQKKGNIFPIVTPS